MSDDKLKSEDGKPVSRKSAEKKTPPAPESTAGTKKTTTVSSKAATANRKTKTTKSSTGKTPDTKTSGQKPTPTSKVVKTDSKKDAPKSSKKAENKKTLQSTDAKISSTKTKDDNGAAGPLTAKPENGTVSRPRKGRSFVRMATVAAVLFLGVLFVFLQGNNPVSEEEQTASKAPSAQVEAPNLNASSPYGMRVEQLKEIEILLSSLNLDPGNIDGDIDHDAVAAISLFQEISGLQVDGRPTPDLLVDLKAVEQLLKIE